MLDHGGVRVYASGELLPVGRNGERDGLGRAFREKLIAAVLSNIRIRISGVSGAWIVAYLSPSGSSWRGSCGFGGEPPKVW